MNNYPIPIFVFYYSFRALIYSFNITSLSAFFSMLEYVDDYTIFTTLCIIIRGFEALGASAFSTASYVYVINLFPNNIGSVIVSSHLF